MRRLTSILFLLFSFQYGMASPQLPDYIIFEKDTLPTYNLIVEDYLKLRAQDDGELFGLSFRNAPKEQLYASPNCWRGYQAIYQVKNDSLFVIDIIDCLSIDSFEKETSVQNLKRLFGNKVKNNRVFVNWFSGILNFPIRIKDNKCIRWDEVFERIFLYENNIYVKKGIQTKSEIVKNYIDLEDGINRMSFDSVNKFLLETIKNQTWKERDFLDCSEEYLIEIKKNGKIGEVRMYMSSEEIKEFFTRKEYKSCIKLIKSALKNFQFDVIKRKGNPIPEVHRLEIWFKDDEHSENGN